MQFSKENQPAKKGRPKGSKNKRSQIPETLNKEALTKLAAAVEQGDSWAIQAVLDRSIPKLKQAATGTEEQLLQAQIELTRFKVKELSEFEERLAALERVGEK